MTKAGSKKKKIVPVVVILVVAAVAFAAKKYFGDRESIYVGTIEVTKVAVSPRVASQVKERLADEGNLVEKDVVLYKLACEDYAVAQQKLKNDYQRAQKLSTSGSMSMERYDNVRAQHDTNALQMDWCVVRAPLAATVLTKFSEVGEWVQPGVRMMLLGDLNDVWAYVYVDQPMLARLSLGQEVTGVLPELNDKRIKGNIIKINDEAEFTPKNAQTRKERTRLVFGVKIKFDNSEKILKPGMPIEVTF